MVSKDPATNKFLTEHGDGHLTSDHYVIGDIFLYVAYREVSPIAASTELSSSQSLSTITVKDVDLSESATLRSDPIISVTNLKLLTPDNKRVLVQDLDLSLQEDKNLLIVGVSGAGKSSLLRAIAGLWTTGDGLITRPSIKNICFLPQRPYW